MNCENINKNNKNIPFKDLMIVVKGNYKETIHKIKQDKLENTIQILKPILQFITIINNLIILITKIHNIKKYK